MTADNLLSQDNLLCIRQVTADSIGELEVSYELRERYEDAVIFVIGATRHDISDAEISVSDFIYTGDEQFVTPHVVYNKTALTEGKDYELSGDYSATQPGTYTITITGIGNYTGEVTVNYQVIEYFFTTKGDVTGDGKVTLEDVQMILRTVLCISKLTDEQKKAADMNDDGKIDLNDTYKILQSALGVTVL